MGAVATRHRQPRQTFFAHQRSIGTSGTGQADGVETGSEFIHLYIAAEVLFLFVLMFPFPEPCRLDNFVSGQLHAPGTYGIKNTNRSGAHALMVDMTLLGILVAS